MSKTKKEHYVPRCYLDRWANEKGQLYVYDKVVKKSRKSNEKDIACERFFYDIDKSTLTTDNIEMLKIAGINPEIDEQFVEHFMASNVEDIYSKLLEKIIFTAERATPWYEKNCFFISEVNKLYFSICLAFQFVRTKTVRNMLKDSSDCLEQVLKDMNVPQRTIDKYILKEGEDKNIHSNMVLDINQIIEMAKSFLGLTWVLGQNKTSTQFYTSDNPIGTRGHIQHPFLAMNGLKSKGVEVFFPLAPKYILIMYDGSYHKTIRPVDRRYVNITELEDIENYNTMCVYTSERCVFSNDGNFAIIGKILDKNPNVFDMPKTQLSWGNKKYYPSNK